MPWTLRVDRLTAHRACTTVEFADRLHRLPHLGERLSEAFKSSAEPAQSTSAVLTICRLAAPHERRRDTCFPSTVASWPLRPVITVAFASMSSEAWFQTYFASLHIAELASSLRAKPR